MNAPHTSQPRHAASCRAAPNRSAPRTRSSCWPKSTRSSRQGKDIVSFCIGQPDFPTPPQRAGRGDRGHSRRQARLHAQRGHRRAARRRGEGPRRAARPRHRARRRRRRRGRQAVHRVHDRVGHRLRRGRRSDLSGARVSRSTNRRSSPTARCRCRSTCARRGEFAFDPAELEAKITPQDAAPHPQHAAESHRRHPRRTPTSTPSPRSCARIRRSGCSPTRSIRASSTTASSIRSRRGPACSSARSSATARRRPGP